MFGCDHCDECLRIIECLEEEIKMCELQEALIAEKNRQWYASVEKANKGKKANVPTKKGVRKKDRQAV